MERHGDRGQRYGVRARRRSEAEAAGGLVEEEDRGGATVEHLGGCFEDDGEEAVEVGLRAQSEADVEEPVETVRRGGARGTGEGRGGHGERRWVGRLRPARDRRVEVSASCAPLFSAEGRGGV